jgi:hypothetical protein
MMLYEGAYELNIYHGVDASSNALFSMINMNMSKE